MDTNQKSESSCVPYEIREICFYKTNNCYINKILNDGSPDTTRFLCFGHFDIIEISDPLHSRREDRQGTPFRSESKNPLTAILDNENTAIKTSEKQGAYSLYVLKDAPDPFVKPVEYGNVSFLMVSRIHCDRCFDEKTPDGKTSDGKPYVELLKEAYDTARNKSDKFESVKVEFYESLELGDIVAIFSGDSIPELVESARCLYEQKDVRDVYSYCGISGQALNKAESIKDDFIDYLSIRYSIKDKTKANSFFEELMKKTSVTENQVFYITGTADAVIDFSTGLKQKKFVSLIKATVESVSINDAFEEIVTHLGLKYRKYTGPLASKNKTNDAFMKAMKVNDLLNAEISASWYNPLVRLLLCLRSMYLDCVMDDLAMLLIPACRAFIADLLTINKNNGKSDRRDFNSDITEFFNYWSLLSEQITDMEGQLFQQPELHTAPIYVPSMVLLFEQNMVQKIADYLNSSNDEAKFIPLLIPEIQSATPLTRPLFDKTDNNKTFDQSPLVITIPATALYEPYSLSLMLIHEAAHCCSREYRNREDRFGHLVNCFSYVLIRLWIINTIPKEDAELSDQFHVPKGKLRRFFFVNLLKTNLHKELSDQLKKVLNNSGNGCEWKTSDLKNNFVNAVASVLTNERVFEEYLDNITKGLCYLKQQELIFNAYNKTTMKNMAPAVSFIQKHLVILIDELKEVYADIVMILLSGCSVNDYYEKIFEKEYTDRYSAVDCKSFLSINEETEIFEIGTLLQEPYGVSWLSHIYRIALVGDAIDHVKPDWSTIDTPNTFTCNWHIIARLIRTAAAGIKNEKTPEYPLPKTMQSGFPIFEEEFRELEQYFQGISMTIWDDLNRADNAEMITSIRDDLKAVHNDSFSWQKLRSVAERYENEERRKIEGSPGSQ